MHVKSLREMFLAGMTMIVGRGSSVLTVSILTRISLATAGGTGVAAFAACWNFLTMIELIPKALGMSTQMLSGLLIGERDKPSLARLIKISLKYSPAISAVMMPIVFLAAPTIADLYVRNADSTTYQMTLEGLQWCSLVMLPCAVALLSNYYCVAAGQFHFATVTTILNNLGFIVPFALILTPYFGMTGLWLAFPLQYVALVLLVFAVTCYHCRRITFRLEDYLLLPDDFDVAKDNQLNMTVTNKAEVVGLSERTQNFCTANGIDNRRSMFAGICIEEMTGNIVDYGFVDGKKHFVDVRVIVNGEQIIIRLRDDCRPFDPRKWAEIHNPDDPTAHIGIRLVRKIATEFDYVNALKLNNLIIKF